MKMETNSIGTVCSESADERTFNIIANDKMFSILSSKIYADKIMAPIRELATNAYDAHVEAGIVDKPFDVCIPNGHSKFYIRDYGKGMDGKQIETLYTTYGYSSKSESNDYVGCLGLGSKSPFAYTDKFMITSIKDGICYKYSCYLDSGVPKVCKFDEYKTDEPSGVKVEFSVEYSDRYEFQRKAKQFFYWFKVKPNFIDFKPEFKCYSMQEFNGVYRIVDYDRHNRFAVLMGNIYYPVDLEWISNDNFSGYEFYANMLLGDDFVFPVPIGSFDISVSRENLESTEKNIKKFGELIKNFYLKEESDAKKELEKCVNKIENYKLMKTIVSVKPWLKCLKNAYEKYLYFENTEYDDTEEREIIFKSYVTSFGGYKNSCNYSEFCGKGYDFTPYANERNHYVIFDEKLKGSGSFREFIKKDTGKNCIVITNNVKCFDWCKMVGFQEKKREDFASYKPARVSREDSYYDLKQGNRTGIYILENKKPLSDFEDAEFVYYVPIKNKHLLDIDPSESMFDSLWLHNFQIFLGEENKIIGLREKEYLKYKDDERFINCINLYRSEMNFTDEEKSKVDVMNIHNIGQVLETLIKKYKLEFDTTFMTKEEKSEYEMYLKSFELNKDEYINTFTPRERLYYNTQRHTIFCEHFKGYLVDKFVLCARKMFEYYPVISTEEYKAIVEYVKWREQKMIKEAIG